MDFETCLTGDEFEVVSAGAEAARLDPEAVAAMREVGIDIAVAQAKKVDPYLGGRFQLRRQPLHCLPLRAPLRNFRYARRRAISSGLWNA
jgi:hypothetical protein